VKRGHFREARNKQKSDVLAPTDCSYVPDTAAAMYQSIQRFGIISNRVHTARQRECTIKHIPGRHD